MVKNDSTILNPQLSGNQIINQNKKYYKKYSCII